jgi:hypothetical protein
MREVKEAFVIAETMKGGLFDSPDAFLASMERSQQEVTSWPDNEIDAFIGNQNPSRLDFFNRAKWRSDSVDLGTCIVWPQMGKRPWAEGYVPAVAELFRRLEPTDSPIWNMCKFSEVFCSRLPIIVSVRGSSTLMIDDGSHRAIAMALARLRSASAWIGELYT